MYICTPHSPTPHHADTVAHSAVRIAIAAPSSANVDSYFASRALIMRWSGVFISPSAPPLFFCSSSSFFILAVWFLL